MRDSFSNLLFQESEICKSYFWIKTMRISIGGKDWNRKKLPFQENILRGFQKYIRALYKAKSKKDLVLTRSLNFEELQGKRR